MILRMAREEKALLEAFLRPAARYMEFGAGGTTFLAAGLVSDWVISVDSSRNWLDAVSNACAAEINHKVPTLIHADIGPLGQWGRPSDPATRHRWPLYHQGVWGQTEAAMADLFMIDGRFRVACFMQVLLHAGPEALIAIHDFSPRPKYHIVCDFASCIATAGTLSVFRRMPNHSRSEVEKVLEAHTLDPS